MKLATAKSNFKNYLYCPMIPEQCRIQEEVIPYYEIVRLLNTIPGVAPYRDRSAAFDKIWNVEIDIVCTEIGFSELRHIFSNIESCVKEYNEYYPQSKIHFDDIELGISPQRNEDGDFQVHLLLAKRVAPKANLAIIGVVLLAIEAYLSDV